jgi:hypothetical protein
VEVNNTTAEVNNTTVEVNNTTVEVVEVNNRTVEVAGMVTSIGRQPPRPKIFWNGATSRKSRKSMEPTGWPSEMQNVKWQKKSMIKNIRRRTNARSKRSKNTARVNCKLLKMPCRRLMQINLLLRCPAGEPHPGAAMWDLVFDKIASPATSALSESAAMANAVRSAPKNDPVVSAEVANIVKSESSWSDRRSDPELAPANVVSSDTASERQKTT